MIPYITVYLANEKDPVYRLNLARKIRKLGIRRLGAQFLFLNLSELQDFGLLCERALSFSKEFEKIFDEVFFAVHAPFRPYSKCSIDLSVDFLNAVAMLSDNFPVKLESVNFHLSHPSTTDYQEMDVDYKKKQACLSRIAENLKKLEKSRPRICVENPCGLTPDADHVTYIGNLASDFQVILSKEISFCLDICHSGLASLACQRIVVAGSCESFPGFFKEEMQEIKSMAELKDYCFMPLAVRAGFIHLSDYSGLRHGIVPGKGDRSSEYIRKFLLSFLAKSREDIGVLVEVEEEDYFESPNTFEAIKIITGWCG